MGLDFVESLKIIVNFVRISLFLINSYCCIHFYSVLWFFVKQPYLNMHASAPLFIKTENIINFLKKNDPEYGKEMITKK